MIMKYKRARDKVPLVRNYIISEYTGRVIHFVDNLNFGKRAK